jgi:hypothetical protein
MPVKKKDNNTDPNQNKYIAEKEYQYAISLMQFATTLLWQQFGVFMLVETIIIGYLGSALIDKNNQLVLAQNLFVFVGSILGFIICILWYSTFEHNHKSYLLRMSQAKRHEQVLGVSLFTEGEKEYVNSHIPRLLRPHGAFRLLIISFSILFVVLIFVTMPHK